ncbi:MAG: Hsp20/alpha crystallin family protein [Acidobacteriaceae bacterium]|nr:Hsp20/alpha crystallin family protein [Acidobacteriaceae bacterium]MBV8572120.1 Hsp20/alpha crystallin family protein [Acidobacteriaceae bacterium]
MADVNVENRSSSRNQQESRSGLQRSQGGGGISRSRGWDPFASFFNPSEFFANPFALMRRMSEEMDRNFGRFYGEGGGGTTGGGWLPAIEVAERGGQFHVHAELPGVKPEDVRVEVANDALIIQGERRSQHEEGSGANYRSERRYGQFYREIPLPDGTNADQAKAQFRDGVLEISIPVPQQVSQRRQIPVNASESGATGTTSAAAVGGASAGTSTNK